MSELIVKNITKEFFILNDEIIYFDEPFDVVPDKNEFEIWLQGIKRVLEKMNVIENK